MRHLLSFMQNEVVLALGWTLLHSLWQGLLLAIVTGFMLLVTRKSAAQKRYELLTGLFLLFIAVAAITFTRELYIAIAHPHYRPLANIAAGRPVISAFIPFTETHINVNRSWASRLKDYFNTHAYLIVTIWFIIFMARFIKLIAELAYIQRLKTYRISEPPQAWKNRLKELMNKMSVNVYVQLLESGIVKVPVVMGILKPVILLPFGLLSQLPPDEIEAILLHELAHIRRRDYFVNLVQSFAETLFFFNPALMWLSSLIREERENCCDDIAIAVTNNKTKYIDALISFQEFNFAKPSFTMGFPGKKNQLLNRVKRIIYKKNSTLNTAEKGILTLSISILIMFSFVAAKNIPISKIRKKIAEHNASATGAVSDVAQKSTFNFQPHEKAEIVGSFETAAAYQPVFHDRMIDTVPVAAQSPIIISTIDSLSDFIHYGTDVSSNGGKENMLSIYAIHRNGTTYRLMRVDDKVTEFSINDKPIDRSEYKNYQSVISAIEKPYRYKRDKIEGDKARAQLLHEADVIKEKLSAIDKEQNTKLGDRQRPIKMKNVDGRWQLVSDTFGPIEDAKRDYLKKQEELNQKLSELDISEEYVHRNDLSYFKSIKVDSVKLKPPAKAGVYTKPPTVFIKNKIDVKQKFEATQLQKKEVALKRELSQTQEKLLRLQTTPAIKLKQDNVVLSDKDQSTQVRKVLEELSAHYYVGISYELSKEMVSLINNGFSFVPELNLVLLENEGHYALGFRSPGTYTVQFKNLHAGDGLVYMKKVFVSKLPDPMVKFNKGINDAGTKNALITSSKIIPYLASDDFAYGIIKSFRVTKISPEQKNESFYNTSDIFQSSVSNLINKSKKGDIIMFDNILITMLDGTVRSTNPLMYKIIDQ